jgi:hypothetical protein
MVSSLREDHLTHKLLFEDRCGQSPAMAVAVGAAMLQEGVDDRSWYGKSASSASTSLRSGWSEQDWR